MPTYIHIYIYPPPKTITFTCIHTDEHKHTEELEPDKHTDKQTDKQTNKQTERQTHRQRHAGRHAGRRKGRHRKAELGCAQPSNITE